MGSFLDIFFTFVSILTFVTLGTAQPSNTFWQRPNDSHWVIRPICDFLWNWIWHTCSEFQQKELYLDKEYKWHCALVAQWLTLFLFYPKLIKQELYTRNHDPRLYVILFWPKNKERSVIDWRHHDKQVAIPTEQDKLWCNILTCKFDQVLMSSDQKLKIFL